MQLWRLRVSFLSKLFSLFLPVGVEAHAVNDLQRFLKLYAESKLNLKALLDGFQKSSSVSLNSLSFY